MVAGLLREYPAPQSLSMGKGSQFKRLLWRLCIMADSDKVPARLRKLASHCGGVPPTIRLTAFPDTPRLADPGNKIYGRLVGRLRNFIKNRAPIAFAEMPYFGCHILGLMADEKRGDVCEAVLAAANAEADAENLRPHTWPTLTGGAAPTGDDVVPLLVHLVHWDSQNQSQ